MNLLKGILLGLLCALTWTAAAQDTNALRTQIGRFETRANVILVKGNGQIGSLALGAGELILRCKETVDLSTGEKVYGLDFAIAESQPPQQALVDEDEVDSLLNAISYLSKVNYEATSLPGFEASYTSKAGLRVIAHGSRQEGGIFTYVQFCDNPRVALSPTQMTQLYDLLANGQKKLAELKAGK